MNRVLTSKNESVVRSSHFVDAILYVTVFLCTWFIFLPFSMIGTDTHHDGIMLKPAMDVAAGQTLFRDTFTQYGAITTYVQAIGIKLLGPSLRAIKYTNVFMYALGITLFAVLWRKVISGTLVLVSFGIWLIFAPFYTYGFYMLPWASVVALPFQALSIFFLLSALSKNLKTPISLFDSKISGLNLFAFLSGAFASMVFLCRTPVGITLWTALIIVYGLLLRRALIPCLTGCFSVVGIFLVHLQLNHALKAWWYQTIVWPQRWVKSTGNSVSSCLLLNQQAGMTLGFIVVALIFPLFLRLRRNWGIAYYLTLIITALFFHSFIGQALSPHDKGWPSLIPVTILLFTLWELIKFARGISFDPITIALGVTSTASWSQYFPVPCDRHIFWGLTPAFGTLVYLISSRIQNQVGSFLGNWKKSSLVPGLLLLFLFTYPALKRYKIAKLNLSQAYLTLHENSILDGIRIPPDQAPPLQKLAKSIESYMVDHPNTPITNMGPDALYSTFTQNLTNPNTPLYIEWAQLEGPTDMNRREDFVRDHQPLVIIQNHADSNVEAFKKRFSYHELTSLPSLYVLVPSKL